MILKYQHLHGAKERALYSLISVANHFANIARADVPVAIAQPVPAVQVASTSVTAVPEVRSRPLWAC